MPFGATVASTCVYIDKAYTAFQEAFQEDFKYSDFFRDHLLRPQHIGDIRREFILVDLKWDLKRQFESKSL